MTPAPSPDRFLAEVVRTDGSSTRIVVDPPRLTRRQQSRVDTEIDAALDDLAAQGVTDPLGQLMVWATERAADVRGYEREAARRGVLAL